MGSLFPVLSFHMSLFAASIKSLVKASLLSSALIPNFNEKLRFIKGLGKSYSINYLLQKGF